MQERPIEGRHVLVYGASHTGGHKFAGVTCFRILLRLFLTLYYLPRLQLEHPSILPSTLCETGNVLVYPPGNWYGRVTPCHVQALLSEDVQHSRRLEELYRGGL